MCGIFGMVRSGQGGKAAAQNAVKAFLMLGAKSEERGTDSSGIAGLIAQPGRRQTTEATRDHGAAKLTVLDHALIAKTTGKFRDLNFDEVAQTMPAGTSVLIGHTRWATQGDANDLLNASPMIAGDLIGTHNGDIDITSIPEHKTHTESALGSTDTEPLLHALNQARRDRSQLTKILKSVVGRAALAFIDRGRTSRLYLARTAMSPIAYAWTANGDFLYASNPDWFRQIERESKGEITFRDITLVPEGHLITVNTLTAEVIDVRRFTPTCRERDLTLLNIAAYKKFAPEDKAAFNALARHRVQAAKLTKKWPALTLAPVIEVKTAEPNLDKPELPQLPEGYELEPLIDWDEVEELCAAGGSFDTKTWEEIVDCDDEDEALALVNQLRLKVAAAAA